MESGAVKPTVELETLLDLARPWTSLRTWIQGKIRRVLASLVEPDPCGRDSSAVLHLEIELGLFTKTTD